MKTLCLCLPAEITINSLEKDIADPVRHIFHFLYQCYLHTYGNPTPSQTLASHLLLWTEVCFPHPSNVEPDIRFFQKQAEAWTCVLSVSVFDELVFRELSCLSVQI